VIESCHGNSNYKKKNRGTTSLQRLEADRLLKAWRKKYANKLKGWDAIKAIRDLRDGKRYT